MRKRSTPQKHQRKKTSSRTVPRKKSHRGKYHEKDFIAISARKNSILLNKGGKIKSAQNHR